MWKAGRPVSLVGTWNGTWVVHTDSFPSRHTQSSSKCGLSEAGTSRAQRWPPDRRRSSPLLDARESACRQGHGWVLPHTRGRRAWPSHNICILIPRVQLSHGSIINHAFGQLSGSCCPEDYSRGLCQNIRNWPESTLWLNLSTRTCVCEIKHGSMCVCEFKHGSMCVCWGHMCFWGVRRATGALLRVNWKLRVRQLALVTAGQPRRPDTAPKRASV